MKLSEQRREEYNAMGLPWLCDQSEGIFNQGEEFDTVLFDPRCDAFEITEFATKAANAYHAQQQEIADLKAKCEQAIRQVTMVRNFPSHVGDYCSDLPEQIYGEGNYEEQCAFRDGWSHAVDAINKRITEIQKENEGHPLSPIAARFFVEEGKDETRPERWFFNTDTKEIHSTTDIRVADPLDIEITAEQKVYIENKPVADEGFERVLKVPECGETIMSPAQFPGIPLHTATCPHEHGVCHDYLKRIRLEERLREERK